LRALLGRTREIGVAELVARKNYNRAIEVVRAALEKRRRDPLLRRQLAEVLFQAGRTKEAAAILVELADDLALSGYAAKAIAVLKRIKVLEPGRQDVEEKLSYMIAQQERPTPDPWIRARARVSAGAGSIETVALPPPPLFPGDIEEIAAPAEAAETEAASAEMPETASAAPTPDEVVTVDEPFQEELLALIEDVLAPERVGETLAVSGEAGTAPAAIVETPLFRDFTCDELVDVIRSFELRRFEAGEIVVTEGEPGDSLFVVTTGAVRAYVRGADGHNVPVRRLGEGSFFGEIALLKGGARTATITALGGSELLEISRTAFDQVALKHPRAWSVLKEFHDKRAGSTLEAAARQALGGGA
jgi:hypothetical protein